MTKKEYADYECAVASGLKGLEHVSTGVLPGCHECGVPDGATDEDREMAEESSFSWSSCDVCCSSLGGDRHKAHGVDRNGDILHLEVCTDCLYYINYGCLDDATMADMEE
jgi:hypothetical protein